ncbi:uncharacterized protein LOC6582647 isoform X1 [Drosophila mojavensis]|uniref:Uncharacterized protein, isoform C n=1 Tax=Drosophila mojavensis TaxID=7230 RepID=B4KYK6_DROMO|nr:uncharacterized protein LOC6582647 isoform X1 [Drosophila mojavensis]EDW18817.2 uncharacterized protein Dmoj_GI13433, isoform C [Drosophila mojavensis]
MKLLGLGRQILAKRWQSSCQSCDEIPPCPAKRSRSRLIFCLLTFGAGVYTGIYVSQNYEVPRVDDPPKLVEKMNKKIRELIEGKKSPTEQIVHDIKKEAKKILDD